MAIGFKQNPDGSWHSYKIENPKASTPIVEKEPIVDAEQEPIITPAETVAGAEEEFVDPEQEPILESLKPTTAKKITAKKE